jgi:hypothetical protein
LIKFIKRQTILTLAPVRVVDSPPLKFYLFFFSFCQLFLINWIKFFGQQKNSHGLHNISHILEAKFKITYMYIIKVNFLKIWYSQNFILVYFFWYIVLVYFTFMRLNLGWEDMYNKNYASKYIYNVIYIYISSKIIVKKNCVSTLISKKLTVLLYLIFFYLTRLKWKERYHLYNVSLRCWHWRGPIPSQASMSSITYSHTNMVKKNSNKHWRT